MFRVNDYPVHVVKSNLIGRPTPTNTTMESQTPPKLLHLPYAKGVSEQIKTMFQPLGGKTVTKSTSTLRGSLVRVKQARQKDEGCKDCPCVYIGETGRVLEKRLSEHKTAVKKHDPNKRMTLQYTLGQTNTRSTGKLPCVRKKKGVTGN